MKNTSAAIFSLWITFLSNSCRDDKPKYKFASIDNSIKIPIECLVNQEIGKCPICSYMQHLVGVRIKFRSPEFHILKWKTSYFSSSTSWKLKSYLLHIFLFLYLRYFQGFFFHLIFAITRKNTLEEVKSVLQDPDASDNFDKLIFWTLWMKHLFWLAFIFMFSINRLSSI